MANERVPLSQRIRPNSEAAQWVCDEVAELERQLEEAKAVSEGVDPEDEDALSLENESLRSDLDAALAQVGMLRQKTADRFIITTLPFGHICTWCWTTARDGKADILHADHCILSNTSATAQQFVDKVRREALEAALDRVSRLPGDRFGRLPAWGSADLRAAILGEKEKG